jgi:hypothetical protein
MQQFTAGLLALKWSKLSFDPARLQQDFVTEVVAPLRALASQTIDRKAIVLGLALPGRVSDRVMAAYRRYLFDGHAAGSSRPATVRNECDQCTIGRAVAVHEALYV